MPFGIGSITISASTFTVLQEIYLTDGEWAIFKRGIFEKSREGRNRERQAHTIFEDTSTFIFYVYRPIRLRCLWEFFSSKIMEIMMAFALFS